MAIFNKTTKGESKKTVKTVGITGREHVIVRPHVTEKAAILAEKGQYVFEVAKDTNKVEIAKAISALYNVTPARVNIINLPRTRVFLRGKAGMKSGLRKALVTLKAGEKIEIL